VYRNLFLYNKIQLMMILFVQTKILFHSNYHSMVYYVEVPFLFLYLTIILKIIFKIFYHFYSLIIKQLYYVHIFTLKIILIYFLKAINNRCVLNKKIKKNETNTFVTTLRQYFEYLKEKIPVYH